MTHWDDVFIAAAGPESVRSPAARDDIDLVVHAWCGTRCQQSHVAERVRQRTGCGRATALQVLRPADSGLAALHVAARYLSASDELRAALVTAEQATAPPGASSARAPEDGATGAVVARGTGAAQLLSTVFLGGPPDGALFRADLPWREPPATGRRSGLLPFPRRRRTAPQPAREGARLLEEPERKAVALAVDEAGGTLSDVARIVRSPDQLTALASLLKQERHDAAPLVVLAGAGRGQDFGCAVLKPV
ncbi:hypothetical protein [Streptomyces sp. NPDC020681]|uniref:hypothetical protein n=1 Tax=Streptomyces sp. NPDC020681 TaxID=3365083 RepID=UPI0037A69719